MSDTTPIGITPRIVHIELRLKDITEAMERHTESSTPIPLEWIVEYNELVKTYKYIKETPLPHQIIDLRINR